MDTIYNKNKVNNLVNFKSIDIDEDLKIDIFKCIFEIIPLGIILIDKNFNVVGINGRCKDIFNISKRKNCLNKDLSRVIDVKISLPKVFKYKNNIIDTIKIEDKIYRVHNMPLFFSEDKNFALACIENITEIKRINEKYEEEVEKFENVEEILENAYDGIVKVDENGYVSMISESYASFLGISPDEAVGKYVDEVIENTRLSYVLKSGKAEIAQIQMIDGNYIVATRIPIIKDNKVVGAIGKVLFKNVEELNKIHSKISKFENDLGNYKMHMPNENNGDFYYEDILGNSKGIINAKIALERAILSDSPVIISGEQGTGRKTFAYTIHKYSFRKNHPFIDVNCNLESKLLEDELFGKVNGELKPSQFSKMGKILHLNGGILFLEEINKMDLNIQGKLLRFLETGTLNEGDLNKSINIRIIASSSESLTKLVKENKFRSDLYYKLNILEIYLPPLRERKEDILILSEYFLKKKNEKLKKCILGLSKETLFYLRNYNWPGNIDELENVIEKAVNRAGNNKLISTKHLPLKITEREVCEIRKLDQIIWDTEKSALIDALIICKFNKSKASKLLGISRSSFYEKLERYDINLN